MKKEIYQSLKIITSVILLFSMACKKNEKTPPSVISASGISNTIFEDYYHERMKWYPFEATSNGIDDYNDRMPIQIAESYRDSLRSFYEKYQKKLVLINRSKLTTNDQVSYDNLAWDLQINLDELKHPKHLLPIDQFDCFTLSFPQMGSGNSFIPFKSVRDYDNWLARIGQFPAWCDTAIRNMERGIQIGWVLPKSLAVKVLPQLKSVIVSDFKKSLFWQPIESLPKGFSETDKKRLSMAYQQAITQQINPSYQKLLTFFSTTYLPKCRTTSGVGAMPNGNKYYAHLARTWTTTDLTPDEIFEIGQKEVARIRQEMEAVKAQVGFKGDLKAFFKYVMENKQLFPYKKTADIMADFGQIHNRMKPQLAAQFDLVPKTPFEVRQTEAFREASASAEYMQGAADGSRPGVFYFPIPKNEATKINNFQNEALFLHEAIPGHHYQISLQQENKLLPNFRRFSWYGAYGEGYALYCESLGKELGLYTDPYQYFGRLGMEMHRAIRLVVDVGLHQKGWTREQAIQYDLDNEAETYSSVEAEVERYMAIPAQALSYKIGERKILELKNKLKATLGNKFDIKKFHNELLIDGCVPLNVLEQKMNHLTK